MFNDVSALQRWESDGGAVPVVSASGVSGPDQHLEGFAVGHGAVAVGSLV
jgi:hypothetical protein